MPYIWKRLRDDGPMTYIEVVVEPGQTAEIPVRTSILGQPVMDELIGRILDKHAETQDQLGDFT